MERLLDNSGPLGLDPFRAELDSLVREQRLLLDHPKGNALKYQNALEILPDIVPDHVRLDTDVVAAGSASQLTAAQRLGLEKGLFQLCPWRKGPFNLFGIHIDAEWQSFLKWDRVRNHIAPQLNARILDIGSSSGYYMFRMASQSPAMVLGLEPQHTFFYQYLALQRYFRVPSLFCLPVPFDALPVMTGFFDTVFCMGILSHRRSPLAMLKKIHANLKPGGEIVVENLALETGEPLCLFPESRYAKMRNVFFIPSVTALSSWLSRTGFTEIRCVDATRTTIHEQRKTQWIQTESLEDFLDPHNPDRTVEGYPAPVRAILIARAG
ncbi:MAG: tRNA 5-methoxyuridine(34)/uridine 5-oxyacetic acid(34) synthase CmoB [Pseudomonadota bacterium]